MIPTDIRHCPVCAASSATEMHRQVFSGLVGLPAGEFLQKIVSCDDCGAVYVQEYLTDTALATYYAAMSNYEYAGSDYRFPEEDRRKAQRQFDYLRGRGGVYDEVLDIGCSLGYTLSLFKTAGSRVLGIEPSPILKQVALEAYGVEVLTGFVDDDVSCLGRRFDLVVLSHVLEHIKRPERLLSAIRSVMKPDGLLFIEVPTIERFDERDLFQFSFEHINYFSSCSLANLLGRGGYALADSTIFENLDGEAPHYPTLGTVWRLGATQTLRECTAHDRAAVNAYLAIVKKHAGMLNERIAAVLSASPRLAIWGAGTLTAQLLAQTPLAAAKERIVAILDSDPKKTGLSLAGIPVMHPDRLGKPLTALEVDAILIGSWSSQNAIGQAILDRGMEPGKVIKLFPGTEG